MGLTWKIWKEKGAWDWALGSSMLLSRVTLDGEPIPNSQSFWDLNTVYFTGFLCNNPLLIITERVHSWQKNLKQNGCASFSFKDSAHNHLQWYLRVSMHFFILMSCSFWKNYPSSPLARILSYEKAHGSAAFILLYTQTQVRVAPQPLSSFPDAFHIFFKQHASHSTTSCMLVHRKA